MSQHLRQIIEANYQGMQHQPYSAEKDQLIQKLMQETGCTRFDAVTAIADFECSYGQVWLDVSRTTSNLLALRDSNNQIIYLSVADVIAMTPALLINRAEQP